MATRENEALAALEACAFWQGRQPFKVRDPRMEPMVYDTLSDGRDQSTVTVFEVTLQHFTPDGGHVQVTREDRFGKIKRFRFTLPEWRAVAHVLRVIHVAGYQAGETAPGRVLS